MKIMQNDARSFHDEVRIVPYREECPQRFRVTKEWIIAMLLKENVSCDVRHVGGTAIPGLCSKPIVDVLVMVDQADLEIAAHTLADNILCLGECGRPGRYFFSEGNTEQDAVYIHLTTADNSVAKDQLRFLALLQACPDLRAQYADLKMRLAAQYPDNRAMYRLKKGVFIENMLGERSNTNTMDKRERLAAIFRDTQQFYSTDPELMTAIDAGRKNTKLYDADNIPDFPEEATGAGAVSVTKSRTFEAAMRLAKQHPGKRIAVLNFASATKPGGGVLSGSSAQEESLCRCSTLYPTLDRRFLWYAYYDVNRAAGDVLHTDACIYSPGVVICKTDTDFPERMAREDWCKVDVISCAAPNLRKAPGNQYSPEGGAAVSITPDGLQRIHEKRARSILAVAARNGADILVLGAFGCGAFRNDPKVVASAYANVLKECRQHFDLIEFAIFCRGFETENYDAFAEALA